MPSSHRNVSIGEDRPTLGGYTPSAQPSGKSLFPTANDPLSLGALLEESAAPLAPLVVPCQIIRGDHITFANGTCSNGRPRGIAGPFSSSPSCVCLTRPDVGGLQPLPALSGLILDGLAILECLEAGPGDIGVMNEQVLATVIRDDEAEPLLLTEPLDSPLCHFVFSSDPCGPTLRIPSLDWQRHHFEGESVRLDTHTYYRSLQRLSKKTPLWT